MASRRRRWIAAGLLALALVAALGWWLAPAPEERAVAQEPRRQKRSVRRLAEARPSAPRAQEAEQAEPDLAIPVGDSGAPAWTAPAPAQIAVRVVYPDGELVRDTVRVFSPDCYASDVTRQGELRLVVLAPRCTVRAGRRDGALWALSDEVEIELRPGEVTDVELVLPEERTGGLGVQIAERDEGIEIINVLPGTPAARAGLEEGDIILEVDGLPTDALTAQEFVEVMTGPAGSEVSFIVGYEGDTGWEEEEHVITRSLISREDR